jgi:N-acetylglutamate synthase-like GNAT family acetyltransferase
VTIRPARRDECARLSDLAFRSKASWGYDEQFMANCRAELTVSEADISAHQFFVLECDGAVVGFCALLDRGDSEGELADVFVEPTRKGEGHGRTLVEHAKDAARARGWHSLRVEADPHAVGFYSSCGASQVGTVPSGSIPGRRLPLMKIDL